MGQPTFRPGHRSLGIDDPNNIFKKYNNYKQLKTRPTLDGDVVAPSRFELESQDPESRMIDRYTTGL